MICAIDDKDIRVDIEQVGRGKRFNETFHQNLEEAVNE